MHQEPSHLNILHAEASLAPSGPRKAHLSICVLLNSLDPNWVHLLSTPQKMELAAYPRCFSTALWPRLSSLWQLLRPAGDSREQ